MKKGKNSLTDWLLGNLLARLNRVGQSGESLVYNYPVVLAPGNLDTFGQFQAVPAGIGEHILVYVARVWCD